jgi:hypothetical protein
MFGEISGKIIYRWLITLMDFYAIDKNTVESDKAKQKNYWIIE